VSWKDYLPQPPWEGPPIPRGWTPKTRASAIEELNKQMAILREQIKLLEIAKRAIQRENV